MESNLIRTQKKERLLSLDVLRGFDMFWITGGSVLFACIGQLAGFDWLTRQMEHVDWEGFTMHDLIFPLFMFISGVAIPFAITSKIEKGSQRSEMLKKVFRRMLTLVILGIIYNHALRGNLTNIRFASVLGQIGLAYFFASVIVIYTRSFKTRLYWLGGILLGYSIIQLFIPVPGAGAGQLTPEGCINGYIDRMLLPGVLHGKVYDPEGLLCIISATGITLMGSVAGYLLRDKKKSEWNKVYLLAGIGAVLVIIALIASPYYPIIKKCWTSTFNLMAGGISFLLLSVFYLLIDVLQYRKWSFYFRVIGMNSIFVYLFTHFIDFDSVTREFTGWTIIFSEQVMNMVSLVGYLALVWGILYYMYKKEIFLRI